jgi:hypothetical protein
MSRFEATVRHRGGVAIIDLRGELDAQADGSLRDAMPRRPRSTPARSC